MEIKFNEPYFSGGELSQLKKLLKNKNLESNGKFTKQASIFLEKKYKAKKVLITHSCTGALELVALLINIKPNDEIIVPSYTYPTSVSSFLRSGAKIKYADIDENTISLNIKEIQKKITNNTKAVVVTNYGGLSCDLLKLKNLLLTKKIFLIEDNAQGLNSKIKKKYLGTIGDFGCVSFHVTKNIHCGAGGALFINNSKFIDKAIEIWDKGTNRFLFKKKKLKRYEWTTLGSNFYPSELQSAFLINQLKNVEKNMKYRKKLYSRYYKFLNSNKFNEFFKTVQIPKYNSTNYHNFFLIFKKKIFLNKIQKFLTKHNISAHTHYFPLHLSKYGKKFFRNDKLPITEKINSSMIRLPLHNNLKISDIDKINNLISIFFSK